MLGLLLLVAGLLAGGQFFAARLTAFSPKTLRPATSTVKFSSIAGCDEAKDEVEAKDEDEAEVEDEGDAEDESVEEEEADDVDELESEDVDEAEAAIDRRPTKTKRQETAGMLSTKKQKK